jgi:hypothetical protein
MANIFVSSSSFHLHQIDVIFLARLRNLNLIHFLIPTFSLQFLLWFQTYMVEQQILLNLNLAFLHNHFPQNRYFHFKNFHVFFVYSCSLVYMCRLWYEWRQWWVHSGEVIIIYRSLSPHFNWWIRVHINKFFKREYNFLFYFYIDFINKSKKTGTINRFLSTLSHVF